MVDKQGIIDHLGELEESLSDLERYRENITLDDLRGDRDKRNMVLHALLVTIQSCIDIANHLIAEFHLRRPETYRESFEILTEAELISQELGDALSELAGFRNVLVHIYWRLDIENAFNILQGDVWRVKEFAKILRDLLARGKER